MKIRSITCYFHPGTAHAPQVLDWLAELAEMAVHRYQQAGYEVQSTRLATVPFPQVLKELTPDAAVEFALNMQNAAHQHGFKYTSLGPALVSVPASYELIGPMLAATKNVFFSAEIATPGEGISLAGIKASAKIIAEAACITQDGLSNLYFAALANVKPYGPFFPAAYSAEARPAFALAIEAADLALSIFQSARSLSAARKRLVQALETQGRVLAQIGDELAQAYEIKFMGIDFSMAPFPQAWGSLGAAMEQLGPVKLGLSGSLAAAAFLSDTLDRGTWQRTGFNGLLMPVMEDIILAERAADGLLTIKDLLLYAALCSTGIDAVPLPGDATPDQLAGVLLDVAAISARLGKPLTARLMPIPGKRAGDPIHFNFDDFVDGMIMALPALPLRGPLGGNENFVLNPRQVDR